MKFSSFLHIGIPALAIASALASAAAPRPADKWHYEPDGRSAVCIGGDRLYNRALYGGRGGFRLECSDTPVFGIYLPGMGGHLELQLPDGECVARYTPGRMDYAQGGVEVEAQVLRSKDIALWRLTNTTGRDVRVPVVFGGVSEKKFSRNGDLGVDPADCFDLKDAYCKDDSISISGSDVIIHYGTKQRRRVALTIPASAAQVTPRNTYEGVILLAPGQTKYIAYFPDGQVSPESPEKLVAQAERERAALASTLTVDSPDPMLNPVGGALAVAADAIWSGEAWLHGSIGWRTPHLGWRGAYAGDALGLHDRALTHFETYAANQVTDRPAVIPHPAMDSTLNLARAEKRWGTPMYSDGYICRRPGKKDEMSHYDMNLVYADAMLRHFLHTGDKAAMRRLFPTLRRHLEWEKLNFDPDGDGLYDAYCCIWASDALYYSGGGVTHSSAYNRFANRLAAEVARAIGEDPAPFEAEAAKIEAAMDSTLWMPEKGVWAEYKDLGGEERLHPYPALWTVYHAVDSEVGDPFKRYAATVYVDREIPHIPLLVADSLYTVSTTNWKPYSWSINNVAIAEVMHAALAYWQAGRPDEAYALMKGVMADNMYSGASPLNFGQISQYDAARGECYRDFADPIGVWSRALTEGLYGIRPDLLSKKTVRILPGFPSGWEHASISLPDISYSFERKGDKDEYTVEGKYPKGVSILLEVPASGLTAVTVNGKKTVWKSAEYAFGEPRAVIELKGSGKSVVRLTRDASRSSAATGSVRSEGPVSFAEMMETGNGLTWWEVTTGEVADPLASVPSLDSFADIRPALCEPVKVPFNASVSDIFKNEYLSPRPSVTTLQLPKQGIGEWCHPKLTADIGDSGLRALSAENEGLVRPLDIPFAVPAEGENIFYTSLWDNYPDSVSVPLSGRASDLYLLMAGSVNHMQWGMESGSLTVNYADGSSESVPLVNPINWAPIEQDTFTDAYAFSQRREKGMPNIQSGKNPVRVRLSDCLASRSLSDGGPYERVIPGGAAILLDLPVDPAKELKSLDLKTRSNDVVIGLMGVTAQRVAPLTDWYRVETVNKPFVRWWWHGSAVDSIGLTHNLTEFADKGLGGVEITPIYGVKGNEANDIDYLSDKWMDMLGHITRESERLGLQVDMNNGTGWPFGGPTITPETSAQKLVTTKWEVAPGHTLDIEIPQPEKQPDARLQYVIASGGDRSIDLTNLLKGRKLNWKAPGGNAPWSVYAIFAGRTYQKVKRAAPGGEGLVINHYDSIAVKHYLDRFDRAFLGREWMMPTSFFNDSYEVYGSDWTEKLPDEFEKDHGYRVELHIADLLGDRGETPERARVLHDYRRTLGRMLEENFLTVWLDWAHRHGATVRNQSHGSPANILDLYASVDIPECESFGQTDFTIPGLHDSGPKRPSDSAPSVLKFASSAAHLTGKPLVSSETLTWLTEHFHTSLAHCKPELDQMFASGVNYVYFHGAPYSPKDVAFPGWLFYASINMSPTAALWENAPGLFEYIARVQSFMTKGTPDNDILLYFPYDDVLTRTGGKPYMMFDIHKMQRVMPDIKNGLDDIVKAGYDVDYISDRLFDRVGVDSDGIIVTTSNAGLHPGAAAGTGAPKVGLHPGAAVSRYRTLIVPDVPVIPEATRARIAELQKAGANVIYSKDIKATAEGLGLSSLEPLRRAGLHVNRRTNEAGGHNYFISCLRDTVIDGFVPLGVPAADILIFDPLTGSKGKADIRTAANGNAEVRLQLNPGESLLLKTFPEKLESGAWRYVASKGKAQKVGRKWTLAFPESDPEIDKTFLLDEPQDWTTLPDDRLAVNRGKGLYKTTFNVKNPASADDWELDLGDVRESARVRVNGQEAGVVWSVPMRLRVGHLLKKGVNEIEIEVTNLEANRIADLERRLKQASADSAALGTADLRDADSCVAPADADCVARERRTSGTPNVDEPTEWKIFKDANIATVTNAKTLEFDKWPVAPSGLLGPVTLRPLTLTPSR